MQFSWLLNRYTPTLKDSLPLDKKNRQRIHWRFNPSLPTGM